MTLALVLFLALAAGAVASTLVVTANSKTPGSVKAPAVQSVDLTEGDIGYVNGLPSRTLVATREQLPASFRADLGPFPGCPSSDFSHLSNTPPPCPAGAQVGSTSFTAYVPSLNLHVNAAGFMYKISDSQVDAWVHVTRPVQFSVALVAILTTAAHAAAPAVNWNLSAAVDLGVKADITSFVTDWTGRAARTVAHLPPRRRHGGADRHRHRHRHRRGHSRTPRSADRRARPARVSVSPFIATGCPRSGEWTYAATLRYSSGAPETVMTSVPCSASAPQTVTVTVTAPRTCLLGVICLPPSRRSVLGARVRTAQPRLTRST
jgi:hypothetical protein